MHPKSNSLLTVMALCAGLLCSPAWASAVPEEMKTAPILHNGRVKAFDSYCRQTLESIAGRERWEKKDH